ncbi:MAG: diaminopimelate epimerase [Muribaculaceae bacterium]|nr:diaminopimelate epimerase [Muribaculaceae bacterium]
MKSDKIHFVKMHGVGNDYIFVDVTRQELPHPARLAVMWSRPHLGIGSDGLVLIGRSPVAEADFSMRIYNADGSEGLMCGNARRCIGKYVYERGLTHSRHIGLFTASGIKRLDLTVGPGGIVECVTVDMLAPALNDESQFLPDGEPLPEGVFVSMGNPHYVLFIDDIDGVDVASRGAQLERHSRFPQRCNIEFAQVCPDGIRVRVWERGSGITMGCGTGACATAVAAAVTGRQGRQSQVVMDGGTLHVEWRQADGHVYLSGPATFVYEGEVEVPSF